MKTFFFLAALFASPAFGADYARDAANEGFEVPAKCGGMETKLGNIPGVILIHRFDMMMKAEGVFATAAAKARSAIDAYAGFCPTFAANRNAPRAQSEHDSLHKAASDSLDQLAAARGTVDARGSFLQKKYADTEFSGTECLKTVNFDVLLVPNKYADLENQLIRAESVCEARGGL